MRIVSSPAGRHALQTASICLAIAAASPDVRAAPYSALGTVNGGVVIVSPTRGTVVYCPATTRTYGTGAGAQVQPTGVCVALGGVKAMPAADSWELLSPGGASFFLVNKGTGKVLQCAVSTFAANTPGGNSSSGTCAESGTFP